MVPSGPESIGDKATAQWAILLVIPVQTCHFSHSTGEIARVWEENNEKLASALISLRTCLQRDTKGVEAVARAKITEFYCSQPFISYLDETDDT